MAEEGHGASDQTDNRGGYAAGAGSDEDATHIAPSGPIVDAEPERGLTPVVVGTSQPYTGIDEATQDLPPEAIIRLRQKAPPQRPVTRRQPAGGGEQRNVPWWAFLVTTVLVVAIVAGAAYAIVGPTVRQHSGVNDINGCDTGSPCQVANSYLAAYTGAKYGTMYSLTSAKSRARFNDPAILNAAAQFQVNSVHYANAQDYILRRTRGIVDQAQVFGMSATLGKVKKVNATQVTFPARVVMHSTGLGDVVVDIVIPLTLEHNAWRVDWSPGLIFPQLDDVTDPNYTRVVRFTSLSANRGTIFSSDGQALALDENVFVIGVIPSKIASQSAVTQALVNNLDLTPVEVSAAYQGKDANTFWPVRTITPMLYAQVSGALAVPGITEEQYIDRVYPFGTTMAPVTGYIGQVGPTEIANDSGHYYQSGDIIGRAGVEEWGEQYLRPVKGGELDIRARNADGSDGSAVLIIAQRAAQNGENIYTTINVAAQQAAMNSLAHQQNHTGGAVALDPGTGDVLAMGSYPTYDPNDFSLGFTANEQTRFNAMDSPYVNRATMAADPVGSVFKLITLSAGLEHGVGASQVFSCKGTFQVPGENHLRIDDSPAGHGDLTAPQAIGPSCDVVFWSIATTLNQKDPNILPTVAKQFGFGTPTGMLGLPASEDNPGIVPDPAWMQKNQNANWSPTDAANLGIGQGFFEATPAQVAQLSAAIANNGKRMRPRLVTKVVATSGMTTLTVGEQTEDPAPLSAANLQIVQASMLGPIYGPNGTTMAEFTTYPVTVAGKTGTAESGQAHPHSWFTCYAPASKLSGQPVAAQIAVGALVEYSGFGEYYAVPVSKAIMSAYLQLSQ